MNGPEIGITKCNSYHPDNILWYLHVPPILRILEKSRRQQLHLNKHHWTMDHLKKVNDNLTRERKCFPLGKLNKDDYIHLIKRHHILILMMSADNLPSTSRSKSSILNISTKRGNVEKQMGTKVLVTAKTVLQIKALIFGDNNWRK